MNGMGIDPMQRMEVRIATLIAEGQERELRVKSLEDKVNYLTSIITNDYNSDVECPTKYMSKSIQRSDKNDLPVADAEAMYKMSLTQDGRDAISVLETIMIQVKNTPEVLPYPISRIVMYVPTSAVKIGQQGPFFAISKKATVSDSPNQWERWCMLVKSTVLLRYLGWRLSGYMPIRAINSITTEMKIHQLVESKNLSMY